MDAPVAALSLDSVSVTYRGPDGRSALTVVQDVTFSVPAGVMMCVAGRSGSGKSSLLNVAAGLIRPSHGEVWWGDLNPFEISGDARARARRTYVGYVFQSGGLVPTLTAVENIALPGFPEGIHPDESTRAAALLKAVGLREDRATHFPAQLSGGEQRRVGIARALFADPSVLIVDEPTSNLDRRTADDIVALIDRLRERSRAILVASHDEHLIDAADNVLRLA